MSKSVIGPYQPQSTSTYSQPISAARSVKYFMVAVFIATLKSAPGAQSPLHQRSQAERPGVIHEVSFSWSGVARLATRFDSTRRPGWSAIIRTRQGDAVRRLRPDGHGGVVRPRREGRDERVRRGAVAGEVHPRPVAQVGLGDGDEGVLPRLHQQGQAHDRRGRDGTERDLVELLFLVGREAAVGRGPGRVVPREAELRPLRRQAEGTEARLLGQDVAEGDTVVVGTEHDLQAPFRGGRLDEVERQLVAVVAHLPALAGHALPGRVEAAGRLLLHDEAPRERRRVREVEPEGRVEEDRLPAEGHRVVEARPGRVGVEPFLDPDRHDDAAVGRAQLGRRRDGGRRQQDARGERGESGHGVTFSSSADAASTSAASSWSTRATRTISLSASG